ncbi:MAG: AlpA family phage regulatory protein [Xanthomonadaceae bacterium]|nr:AlpA family phage regulatory protein [Xanthomonadaceae bacterium]
MHHDKLQEYPSSLQVLRLAEVCHRTGLSKSQVLRMIDEKGFPRPIKLSVRANGWIESEVSSWIRERIARSRAEG